MECTYAGATTPSVWFWAAAADPAEVVPDPRVLAQQALAHMDLTAIRIGSMPRISEQSPRSTGIVGFNVWLWADQASASTYGPITKSATAGGYTVTATAQVSQIVWDMGNGDVVVCEKGTPFTGQYLRPEQASPDCGYTYTKDGDYQVTATSHWEVAWSGIGQSGTIPLDLVAAGTLTIAEIQVLNVAAGQN